MIKVTLAQISPKLSKDNVDLHEEIIKKEIGKSDIVIFPELSLNGYLLMDRVYDDAYVVEELENFKTLSKEIDIVLGLALREEHRIYNSAIYFSGGEIVHIHHKNNLPNYGMFEEARFFFEGDSLSAFDTKFGTAMMVVCEDMWSSKVIAKIADEKPDMLIVIANSPTRGFSDDGLIIQDKWMSVLKTTSILSGANVVFVNRVGFEDGLGFWGGSMVIGADAVVKKSLGLFDSEIKTVDLEKNLSNTQKYMLRNS